SPTMPRMRTLLFLSLVLVGCSDNNNSTPADAAPDAATVKLDCPTYCSVIMTNCTGASAQYTDMAHCTGSCAAFTVGTSTVNDMTGDTLGCRIYHAGAAGGSTANATLHCPHAGPGGDLLSAATTAPGFCSGGDFCTNFCALQIKTCGTTAAPVTLGGTAITPQYQDMATCVSVCKNGNAGAGIAAFDVTHAYGPTSAGNSLACRLNHWTNAAANAAVTPPTTASIGATNTHCGHTGAAQMAGMPCNGAPSP
ncbi:MAG TPA: hypothetical protein VF483_10070, partial [Gemmatimonadaceae bacterium]